MGSVSPRTELPLTQDRGHIPVVTRLLIKSWPRGLVVQLVAPASAPRSRKVVCDQDGPNQLTFSGLLQNAGTRHCVQ